MRQFINYYTTPSSKEGKFNKISCDINGVAVNAHDVKYWLDYEDAIKYGPVGFVLNGNGYWCLDLDDCSELPNEIVSMCQGHDVYIERSISGNGFHIWGVYKGELPEHACKNTQLNIELYTNERFIALGQPITPVSFFDLQNARPSNSLLETLIYNYFQDGNASNERWNDLGAWINEDNGIEWHTIKRRKTSNSSNPFNNNLSLIELCNITREDWEQSDKSSLDIALLNHLAFNTGKNHAAMERLYRTSNIGQFRAQEIPNKIDNGRGRDINGERVTYLQRSILKAVGDCREIYKTPSEMKEERQQEKDAEIQARMEVDEPDTPAGYYTRNFVCIYQGDSPKYIDVVSGHELGKTTFKDCFKIDCHDFERNFPDRVLAGKEYRPDQPLIFNDGALRMLNTYHPPPEPVTPAKLTTDLLDYYFAAICPNENHRKWLTQWCAHAVQYPYKKILSSAILAGRQTGTGKSILGILLSKAMGKENTARLSNDTLNDQFNDWLNCNTLAVAEELSAQHFGFMRREIIKEKVKEWISGYDSPIRAMRESSKTKRNNIAIFLFTTNKPLDAMPIDPEDRRFFVLEVRKNMAIQNLISSGAFTHIAHEISDNEIAGYFHDINLDGFNHVKEPPVTDAKLDMIEFSKDDTQALLEESISDDECPYITEDYAFAKPLASHLGITSHKAGKYLRNMGYKKYSGQSYWLKNGTLPNGLTHPELIQKYNMLKG